MVHNFHNYTISKLFTIFQAGGSKRKSVISFPSCISCNISEFYQLWIPIDYKSNFHQQIDCLEMGDPFKF